MLASRMSGILFHILQQREPKYGYFFLPKLYGSLFWQLRSILYVECPQMIWEIDRQPSYLAITSLYVGSSPLDYYSAWARP